MRLFWNSFHFSTSNPCSKAGLTKLKMDKMFIVFYLQRITCFYEPMMQRENLRVFVFRLVGSSVLAEVGLEV